MSGVNTEEEGAMEGCVWARRTNQEWLGVGFCNGQAEMVHSVLTQLCKA